MTRVFFFDEQGTFFSKEDPNPPQKLKVQIIATTWAPDMRVPWDNKPISVHIHGNMVFVTPQGCSEEEREMGVPNLTARELEVLEALVDGLGYKEIGQRLCISPITVKSYVSTLKKKLNADTPITAVARAVALGLCMPKLDQKR